MSLENNVTENKIVENKARKYNNLKSIVKMDLSLVATYWKWLLLFVGISTLMFVLNRDVVGFIISMAFFAGTVPAFPFEFGEKSNSDVLLSTLPTNRRTILMGRYLFIGVIIAGAVLLSVALGLVLSVFSDQNLTVSDYLLAIAIFVGVSLFNTGFQTPFFYKKGYMKGRIYMWLPIILLTLITMFPAILNALGADIDFNVFVWVFSNALLSSIIMLSLGIISIVVSFICSSRIYGKKDF